MKLWGYWERELFKKWKTLKEFYGTVVNQYFNFSVMAGIKVLTKRGGFSYKNLLSCLYDRW